MKADFSGYATKAGLTCSDGKTIMPDAFKHQHNARVPLVWQHGHTDPENVLGHAILENRPDGVYAYAFWNKSKKAEHARELVEHKDINSLSIWANQLIQRSGKVLHGAIREVSLVLAGANPGALIENVTLRHDDGEEVTIEDEAIITTGLELEHAEDDEKEVDDKKTEDEDKKDEKVEHADDEDGETIEDVYNTLDEKQKEVVHFMIGEALAAASDGSATHSGTENNDSAENGDKDKNDTAVHGETKKEGNTMTRNVFEKKDEESNTSVLSHDDMVQIFEAAKRGSMKEAVTDYCIAHGITDIDTLFPDARAIDGGVPEWDKRRSEWVDALLGSIRKSPFARIRTTTADLTGEEARAKGYVTGAFKKEEFFPVARRSTTPTTVYKKQALDRDDVVDITDFDVVAWLKGEMRLMLDEEIARAVLIGDGRPADHEDKINEGNIRPIATDHELYTTTINVNVGDASSDMNEVTDAIIANRAKLKGSGSPTMYTTEIWIAKFMMLRDGFERRMYRTLDELAAELRVKNIVAVEVLQEMPDIVAILVNPVDYVLGADKGGQVSMFDDFDIDYNKQKYLIETRLSGALTKLKSALVVRNTAAANVLASPAVPTFDPETGALTIVNTTGVVYKHGVTTVNAAGSPYTVPPEETWVIDATPAAGYYFATSDDDQWSFTADA